MSLHGGVDGDDVARWNGRALLMDGPPVMECLIGTYIEALFWWWGFSECVGYVGAVDEHVFAGGYGIEESGACLVNAVCIGFVEDLDVTRTGGAVTHAPSLLSTVGCLDCVRPDKMEYCVVGMGLPWAAKHALFVVLVQLEIFGCVPFVPIVEFEEFAASELHGSGCVVEHLTGGRDVVLTISFMPVHAGINLLLHSEVGAVVELVEGELGEV